MSEIEGLSDEDLVCELGGPFPGAAKEEILRRFNMLREEVRQSDAWSRVVLRHLDLTPFVVTDNAEVLATFRYRADAEKYALGRLPTGDVHDRRAFNKSAPPREGL